MRPFLSVAVEGWPDAEAVRRLARHASIEVKGLTRCRGKSDLDKRLPNYVEAARWGPWFVLRDLDRDADCAPSLARALVPDPPPLLHLRIAVREIESWAMGDRGAFCEAFKVPDRRLPVDPEALLHPKQTMLRILAKSRSRKIRQAMVPAPGTTGREGPEYASQLGEYFADSWRPEIAAERCDSLRRAIAALLRVADR